MEEPKDLTPQGQSGEQAGGGAGGAAPGATAGGPEAPGAQAARGKSAGPAERAAPVKPRRRRWRKWLFILLGLLTPIIVLIAAAPTILSTRWARVMLLNRLNATLDGAVEVDDWSLSWIKGAVFSGVRVNYEGRTILQAERITTDRKLWDMLGGDGVDLGRVDVEAGKFILTRYNDGTTNIERMLEKRRAQGAPAQFIRGDIAALVEGTIEFEQPDGSLRSFPVEQADIYVAGEVRRGADSTIRQIDVKALEARVGPLEAGLDEPIHVTDPMGNVSASGAVEFSGQLRSISDILENMGWISRDWAMSGTCTGSERLSTADGVTWLDGQINLDIKLGDENRPRLDEKKVRVSNQIGLSPADGRLLVRNLSVETRQSGAIAVAVRGEIGDWRGQQVFKDMKGELSYNAAKLPALVGSLIGGRTEEELKGLRLTGSAYKRPFTISGRIPHPRTAAGDPHPLEQFAVRGSLLFASAGYHGLYAENVELPIDWSGGHLRSMYSDRPAEQRLAAASPCNGGLIQLSGLDLLLEGGTVRLSTLQPDLKVLENVKTTHELLQFLGEAQPLFGRLEKASASVDLTVEEASNLPLGAAIRDAGDPGRIRLNLSLLDMSIKSRVVGLLATELTQMKLNEDGSLPGNIRGASIEIRGGKVYSDLGIDIGGQVLGFRRGEVVLGTRQIVSLTLAIPKEMIPLLRGRDSIKDPIEIPLQGYLDKLEVPSISEFVKKLLDPRKALDLIHAGGGGT